jgi:hypothetical protein
VLAGTLDVCVGGEWRVLKPEQSVTVPAGTAHTLKNTHAEEVRLLNVHKPPLAFERFFRRFNTLVCEWSTRERLRRWLWKKHARQARYGPTYSYERLHDQYGLIRFPMYTKWQTR